MQETSNSLVAIQEIVASIWSVLVSLFEGLLGVMAIVYSYFGFDLNLTGN